jgi:thiamine-monophosphate kinase
MGAKPLAAFLSLALPKDIARDPRWLNGFLDGLLALAAIHHVPLAGGDTSESPNIPTGQPGHILADITLLGAAPRHRALRRSTARPGDLLYVTGALGGASIELAALSSAKKSEPQKNSLLPTPYSLVPVSPHLFPTPRIAVGRALLRRRLATACIDLSDGLSTDLTHLCAASHVAAEVDAAAIPLHPLISTLTPEAALHAALHGGEDYELLFTAAPSIKIPHSIAGIRVSRIGRIVSPRKSRPTITLIDSKRHRTPLEPGGWEHLQ